MIYWGSRFAKNRYSLFILCLDCVFHPQVKNYKWNPRETSPDPDISICSVWWTDPDLGQGHIFKALKAAQWRALRNWVKFGGSTSSAEENELPQTTTTTTTAATATTTILAATTLPTTNGKQRRTENWSQGVVEGFSALRGLCGYLERQYLDLGVAKQPQQFRLHSDWP